MIHLIFDQPAAHAPSDLPEHAALHHRDGDYISTILHLPPNLLVREPHHTGSIHLNDLMVRQKTISSSRAVDRNGCHRPSLHLDPQPARLILVQHQATAQGTIPDSNDNFVHS